MARPTEEEVEIDGIEAVVRLGFDVYCCERVEGRIVEKTLVEASLDRLKFIILMSNLATVAFQPYRIHAAKQTITERTDTSLKIQLALSVEWMR